MWSSTSFLQSDKLPDETFDLRIQLGAWASTAPTSQLDLLSHLTDKILMMMGQQTDRQIN